MRPKRIYGEKELLKPEQILLTVLNSFPGMVFWKDIHSNYLGCNQAFASGVGLKSPSEIIFKTDFDLPWTIAEAENYRLDDREILQMGKDKRYVIEKLENENGEDKWLETSKVSIKGSEGQVIGMIGFLNDITERKNAEDALQKSEERYKSFVSQVSEGVFRLESVQHLNIFLPVEEQIDFIYNHLFIEECNYSFMKMYGNDDLNDIIGKNLFEFHGEKYDKLNRNIWRKFIMNGYRMENEITEEKTLTGETIFISNNSIGIIENNHLVRIWGTQIDITKRKIADEIIEAKNKELENYLYVTSHDLRSPLVNIQGFSQRLQKQTDAITQLIANCQLEADSAIGLNKITTEDIPKTLNFILSNVAKMDALINGLLQISRTGRIKMVIRKINMDILFHSIISTLNFQVSESGAQVIIEKISDCYGDENQLNQLFTNIIVNALKYRDKQRKLIINISSQTTHNKVVYRIQDTGIGIDKCHIEKIWDIFYRVDSSSHEPGEGIGLSLSKRIIDKHRGEIRVESELGKGSTFIVELQKDNFSE